MHLIIRFRLEQFPFIQGLTEIVKSFPNKIFVFRFDMRPECAHYEIGIVYSQYLILIITDILFEHPSPL